MSSKDGSKPKKGSRITYAERVHRAWNLRVAGMSWVDIANTVGYSSDKNAMRAVRNYTGTLPQIDTESMRMLSHARGEFLWKHSAGEVERTNGAPASIRAATDVLRHQDALHGLATANVGVQVTPSDDEFMRWVRSLLDIAGGALPVEADIFDPRYNSADAIDADVVDDEPVAIMPVQVFDPPDDPPSFDSVALSPEEVLRRFSHE